MLDEMNLCFDYGCTNVGKWAYMESDKPGMGGSGVLAAVPCIPVWLFSCIAVSLYSWEESAAVSDYKPPAQIHIINRVKSLCSRWNPRRLARHFVRDYAIPSRQDWQSLYLTLCCTMLYVTICHTMLYRREDWPNSQFATCSMLGIWVTIFNYFSLFMFIWVGASFLLHWIGDFWQPRCFLFSFFFSSRAIDRAVPLMQGAMISTQRSFFIRFCQLRTLN